MIMMMMIIIIIIIIEFGSVGFFLTCWLSSTTAYYKVITRTQIQHTKKITKTKTEHKHIKQ